MNGIHIDFFHQTYNYITDKNVEIDFRNKVLDKFIKINNLAKKNIYIHKKIVEIMIEQCEYVLDHNEYWKRYGYTDNQQLHIIDTYKMIIKLLKDYEKMRPKEEKLNNKFYRYALERMTGMIGLDMKKIQATAFEILDVTEKKIILEYGSIEKAKEEFNKLTSKLVYKNETEIFNGAKNYLYKLSEYSRKELFNEGIKIPSYNKIKIKKMPELKEKYGPIGRVYDNILYINTEGMDRLNLFLTCAREVIPGTLMSKENIKTKSNKIINAAWDGWGLYAEDLVYKNDLYKMLKQMQQMSLIITDIGLNTNECIVRFEYEKAERFIEKYSITKSNTLRLLEKPGKLCSGALGYMIIRRKSDKNKDIKGFNSQFMQKIKLKEIK
jgi:hypothetical protein